MAASAEERTPFDLAGKMRSVGVTPSGMTDGKLTMLVMDQQNSNEVIAFLTCDISTGTMNCSDRHNRAVFTAGCGVNFQGAKEVIVWVDLRKGKFLPAWRIRPIINTNRYIAEKSPFSKNDQTSQFVIERCSNQSKKDWVSRVMNQLSEEVCIMRCERMTINITYYKSMNDEAKLLLLAFAAKHLYLDFPLAQIQFPSIVLSRISPSTALPNRHDLADFTIAKAGAVNLAAIVGVIIYRAGYNKALGIQYYDVFNRNTGVTQLTFEVSLEDKQNITAVLKDCYGTTILTASKLLGDLNIKLTSEETITFDPFYLFNVHYPRFYDNDGKIFLVIKRLFDQAAGQCVRTRYRFYLSEDTEDHTTVQAMALNRRQTNATTTFNNPKLDARRKAVILAFALRSAFLDFNSHTVEMPPIDYCYSKKL